MQPEHLYLLFGILGNLSKILFIKLPASDEKEAAKSDFILRLHSILQNAISTKIALKISY